MPTTIPWQSQPAHGRRCGERHAYSFSKCIKGEHLGLKGAVCGGPMDLGEMMAILQGGSPHTIVCEWGEITTPISKG